VDYTLFIMVAVLVMLERLEKRSGIAPAAFPPRSFTSSASISLFHVSPPPPRENASGSLYIGVFLCYLGSCTNVEVIDQVDEVMFDERPTFFHEEAIESIRF
jgi:hypothetical protein